MRASFASSLCRTSSLCLSAASCTARRLSSATAAWRARRAASYRSIAARGGRATNGLVHGVGCCVCAGVQQQGWQHQQLLVLLLWMQIAVVQHCYCSTQGCRRYDHPRHRKCCCVSPFTSHTHTRTSASSACRLALRAASARSFASMAACWAAVISACFLSCREGTRRHHPTRLKHQVSSRCCTTVTQSRGCGALTPA